MEILKNRGLTEIPVYLDVFLPAAGNHLLRILTIFPLKSILSLCLNCHRRIKDLNFGMCSLQNRKKTIGSIEIAGTDYIICEYNHIVAVVIHYFMNHWKVDFYIYRITQE